MLLIRSQSLTTLPTFYRLAGQHRHSFPGRTALVYRDLRLTFADLYDRTNRLANLLKGYGVDEGDRVLWLGQNAHQVVEAFLACSRLGASLCVGNWRQSVQELAFIIGDIQAKVIFWQEEEVGAVTAEARAAANVAAVWIRTDAEGPDTYESLLAEASDDPGEEAISQPHERPLLVLYSAAFGGKPNGAQLSDMGLFLQALTHVAALGVTGSNVAMVSTPLFHIAAWLDLMPTFMMGGKVVIARRTEAAVLCELIHEERINTGRVHVPVAQGIAEYNADRRFDLSCFLSTTDVPGWNEMTGKGPPFGGTGQTEVAGPIVVAALGGQGSTPFSGRIAPIAEAKIIDDAGDEVAPGELGELLIRGPVAGLGYWNRAELNAQRTSDGWWRTNDFVRRDPDGTISFVGPKMQMIKTGGENVYPAEVEAAIQQHPDVARAAIIGTPDATWTQIVTAIVVPKPGATLEMDAVREHLRGRIARYKIPRVIHFVDAIPLNGATPDYRQLDDRFGGGNYPGQTPRA